MVEQRSKAVPRLPGNHPRQRLHLGRFPLLAGTKRTVYRHQRLSEHGVAAGQRRRDVGGLRGRLADSRRADRSAPCSRANRPRAWIGSAIPAARRSSNSATAAWESADRWRRGSATARPATPLPCIRSSAREAGRWGPCSSASLNSAEDGPLPCLRSGRPLQTACFPRRKQPPDGSRSGLQRVRHQRARLSRAQPPGFGGRIPASPCRWRWTTSARTCGCFASSLVLNTLVLTIKRKSCRGERSSNTGRRGQPGGREQVHGLADSFRLWRAAKKIPYASETKSKVVAAAAKLGYKPSKLARGLTLGQDGHRRLGRAVADR